MKDGLKEEENVDNKDEIRKKVDICGFQEYGIGIKKNRKQNKKSE
jgi:hypothetical protein